MNNYIAIKLRKRSFAAETIDYLRYFTYPGIFEIDSSTTSVGQELKVQPD